MTSLKKQKNTKTLRTFFGKWMSACCLAAMTLVLAPSADARQVITNDVREWAREAIKNEQALDATTVANTISVLYFNNRTEWQKLDPLRKGIAIMLLTDLHKVKELTVLERVKLEALVQEMNLAKSGLLNGDTAPRLGKLIGAEYLVGGDIILDKLKKFSFESDLLNVPAEKVDAHPTANGDLLTGLFKMEKELLFDIVSHFNITITPELETELKKTPTDNLDAIMALFLGLEQSDLASYIEAAELYKKALDMDPDFLLAQEFLNELIDLGLYEDAEAYSDPDVPFGPENPNSNPDDGDNPPDRDDKDGDGYAFIYDCNDDDASIYPGATEIAHDGIDQDCDGADLNDVDGDGFSVTNDCDDEDASIYPGAPDLLCDGIDQNCDGVYDCPTVSTPPVVDDGNFDQAIADYNNSLATDSILANSIDQGDFLPGSLSNITPEVIVTLNDAWGFTWDGNYIAADGTTLGLQTVALNADGDPDLLAYFDSAYQTAGVITLYPGGDAPATVLSNINNDTLLAYAVQVEEDILNQEILLMHSDTASALGSDVTGIQDALASNDIRERDYWLMQTADAQAGKVLVDRNGDWVRTQQYVLRPDDQTVQLLNVSLRGTGAHAGLSSLDFITSLKDGNTLPVDLRSLPWNSWLNTLAGDGGLYLEDYSGNPHFLNLDSMSVKLTAPDNDFLQASRTVGIGWGEGTWGYLPIDSDMLDFALDGVTGEYTNIYTGDAPQDEYWVSSAPGALAYYDNNDLVGPPIASLDIYSLNNSGGITDRNPDTGEPTEATPQFNDIWDVLRVNMGGVEHPNIGSNNIEIAVRQGDSPDVAIDVLYIPMSHMIWRN